MFVLLQRVRNIKAVGFSSLLYWYLNMVILSTIVDCQVKSYPNMSTEKFINDNSHTITRLLSLTNNFSCKQFHIVHKAPLWVWLIYMYDKDLYHNSAFELYIIQILVTDMCIKTEKVRDVCKTWFSGKFNWPLTLMRNLPSVSSGDVTTRSMEVQVYSWTNNLLITSLLVCKRLNFYLVNPEIRLRAK